MKRNIFIPAAVFALVLLLAAGAWAWFTYRAAPSAGRLTAGTVQIEINEHGFKDIVDWHPGSAATKKVSVKTRGTKCAYVRLSLTPIWGRLEGDTFVAEPGLPVDKVTLDWNEEHWVCAEGWYYYREVLCPDDEETELLLQSVTLAPDPGGDYDGKILRIVVAAEAVQASHEAYRDAWGLNALPEGVAEYAAP